MLSWAFKKTLTLSVSSEVRAAVQATADELSRGGAMVHATSPLLPDLMAVLQAFGGLVGAFVSQGQPGPVINAHEWLALLDEQARARAQCRRLFEAFDVLLMPAFGTTAFKHFDTQPFEQRTLRIDGADTPFAAQGAWSALVRLRACRPRSRRWRAVKAAWLEAQTP